MNFSSSVVAAVSCVRHFSSSWASTLFFSDRTWSCSDPQISCPNYFKSRGLLAYGYHSQTKQTYLQFFQILLCGFGKPVSSSLDVCISRAEGVECLLCKSGVAKSGPPAPMIHGAFHFRVRDRYIIRILCRRTIRCHSRVSLCP